MRVPKTVAERLASLLILTALSGCDNVKWGGAEFQIVPAPPAGGAEEIAPDAETFADLGLPTGTVVFHVSKDPAGAARVYPVAEVSGDSLRTLRRPSGVAAAAYEARFRQAVMEPNAQLQLFRRGASVGSLTINGAGASTSCGIPTALGIATTVAAAVDATEFIAFRRGLAPEVIGEYSPPQVNGSIQRYASIVAERLVLNNGLPRPRSWTGAQRDLQALEIVGRGNPEMAATYLVGDQLGVGAAEPEGYSIFYIAGYDAKSGYTPFYNEVRDYRKTGKQAPRMIDYLNWNKRGGAEVLVHVFGEKESWYEVVSQDRGRKWAKVWEGPRCRTEAGPAR